MIDMIPVKFKNKDGLNLFGIVHTPSENLHAENAIIILSPGIKSRVAPHRLYVKMAREYAGMGFLVLRFDFYGLGDSEGEIGEELTANLYGSIQVGRYIEDTTAAMDWLQEEYGVQKFILAGLCGGAITGLHAGARDDRVTSLISLGIPVILDSSDVDSANYITTGQLKDLRSGYVRKIFDPKSWMRFLSFKSDYKILLNSLLSSFRNKKQKKEDTDKKSTKEEEIGNFNKLFPESFLRFSESKKILLVFSETDRLFWEYEEKFASRFQTEINQHKNNLHLKIVKEANHIFSFEKWQNEMLKITNEWLENNGNS